MYVVNSDESSKEATNSTKDSTDTPARAKLKQAFILR